MRERLDSHNCRFHAHLHWRGRIATKSSAQHFTRRWRSVRRSRVKAYCAISTTTEAAWE